MAPAVCLAAYTASLVARFLFRKLFGVAASLAGVVNFVKTLGRLNQMKSEKPYDLSKQTSPAVSPSLLFWSIGAVFGSGALGGVLGALIGAALGIYMPGYYRSIFLSGSAPGFDPVAVGIGQGVTQGVVFGALVGLALVAMFYWYRSRPQRQA